MFIITGGGSGIGRALAQVLAAANKKVLIIGRREQALIETAAASSMIDYISADVSTTDGQQAIFHRLEGENLIEALVHNAGIIEPIMPLTSISKAAWQQALATNLSAPLFLTQLLLEKLKKGRVLHLGSGAAYFPITGWSAYCVSKAALAMLTRCWQLENPGLAMASVMPGIIDTDMQALIRQADSAMDLQKLHFFKQLQIENRLLSTATVARFLSWLLLSTEKTRFSSQEWDIYEPSHHKEWLPKDEILPSIELASSPSLNTGIAND